KPYVAKAHHCDFLDGACVVRHARADDHSWVNLASMCKGLEPHSYALHRCGSTFELHFVAGRCSARTTVSVSDAGTRCSARLERANLLPRDGLARPNETSATSI